jgi:hypothetical protein
MTDDMRAVIIPKSDQLNADTLITGPITVRISAIKVRSGTEQPVAISFDGDDGKPYKPCKTMSKLLCYVWESSDSSTFVGKSMTLYRDADVLWGGLRVGGIRISHVSHIDAPITVALQESKQKRRLFTVRPLEVQKSTTPPRATTAPQPPPNPATTPLTDLTPDVSAWADEREAEADSATDHDAFKAAFNETVKHPHWEVLKNADPGRAKEIYDKSRAVIAGLKG